MKAVITWQGDPLMETCSKSNRWQEDQDAVTQTGGSTQQVELCAVILALRIFIQEAVNLCTFFWLLTGCLC